MKCLSCVRGLTSECREFAADNQLCDTVTGGGANANVTSADQEPEEVEEDNEESDRSSTGPRPRIRRTKPDQALKDQQSTGRKRAARLYPLDRDALCEWAFKSRQGGGTHPIEGCLGNKQRDRHHGPDKNTLNNDPGNVHRICHFCHHGWHAKNDPDYDPNQKLRS